MPTVVTLIPTVAVVMQYFLSKFQSKERANWMVGGAMDGEGDEAAGRKSMPVFHRKRVDNIFGNVEWTKDQTVSRCWVFALNHYKHSE